MTWFNFTPKKVHFRQAKTDDQPYELLSLLSQRESLLYKEYKTGVNRHLTKYK